MTILRLVMDASGEFKGMRKLGAVTAIGRLPYGMDSGRSTVVIEVELGGKLYYGETSLAMLDNAVQAFKARDEVEGLPR